MKTYIFSIIIMATLFVSCSKDDDGYDNPPTTGGEHTISTTGNMTFSPSTLNAVVGDKITFTVGSGHTATKVSEATWQANRSTSNGGFDYSSGTNTYTLQASDVGTIYYVCKFHVSMGMKGKIVVSNTP